MTHSHDLAGILNLHAAVIPASKLLQLFACFPKCYKAGLIHLLPCLSRLSSSCQKLVYSFLQAAVDLLPIPSFRGERPKLSVKMWVQATDSGRNVNLTKPMKDAAGADYIPGQYKQ